MWVRMWVGLGSEAGRGCFLTPGVKGSWDPVCLPSEWETSPCGNELLIFLRLIVTRSIASYPHWCGEIVRMDFVWPWASHFIFVDLNFLFYKIRCCIDRKISWRVKGERKIRKGPIYVNKTLKITIIPRNICAYLHINSKEKVQRIHARC